MNQNSKKKVLFCSPSLFSQVKDAFVLFDVKRRLNIMFSLSLDKLHLLFWTFSLIGC